MDALWEHALGQAAREISKVTEVISGISGAINDVNTIDFPMFQAIEEENATTVLRTG